MKRVRIERIILSTLWLSSVVSFSIAIIFSYSLFFSDYIGLACILFVTIISACKQKYLFSSLFFILTLGMLNIASFIYFFNIVVSFGYFGKILTPGIQLYSLLLFFILILYRRPLIIRTFQKWIGNSKEDEIEISNGKIYFFKNRFRNLSESEIQKRLRNNLTTEAETALKELLDEIRRKNENKNLV